MDKELSGPELRKLVKELMLKKLIKEDDDDELGIYGTGFDAYEFDNDAMRAAMADIKADGQNFEPLGKSKFEKNLDVDAMKNDLSMANLNLPKEKDKMKQIQQNLDKRYKHEKQFGVGSLNENEDFPEGPQPGDMEYHYQEPPAHQKGIGEFKNIDWKVLHEILVANDEYNKTNKVEKWPNFIGVNVGDLLDDGYLSKEEIDLLENRGIIEIRGGGYPSVADDSYNNYETFLHAAKEAWEKGFDNSGLNQDHNIEAPFMRGRELDENEDSKNFTDFDTSNLYKFLKDAMYYIETNAFDYAEGAHLLEKALLEKFNITKKGAPTQSFSLNENPNVNPNSKIDRPKDAEGNPITNGARVEDLETGTIGRVLHPGIDGNGNLTIHVDWIYGFGDAIVKPVVYPNKIVVRDDNRIVREEEIEEGMGQSHTVGKGQNIKPGNYPQTLKRVGLKENLDQAVHTTDDEVFFVVDNDFNRAHYKDLIGKTFDDAPGYAQVKLVKRNEVPVNTETPTPEIENEVFDYTSAEREHSGQQELNALSSEAEQRIPEELIKFMIPGSFNMTDADEDGRYEMSFTLKIPKQSDETVKDVESFIREYVPTDIGGPGQSYQKTSLYTELEKGTNKWIINVSVSKRL